MPRKVRIPADPSQSRANQQRSRARRKEHLASLEARLREYEAAGVQATLEMQRASRYVAWKNGKLMELLRRLVPDGGVGEDEVERWLAEEWRRENGGQDGQRRGVGKEEEEGGRDSRDGDRCGGCGGGGGDGGSVPATAVRPALDDGARPTPSSYTRVTRSTTSSSRPRISSACADTTATKTLTLAPPPTTAQNPITTGVTPSEHAATRAPPQPQTTGSCTMLPSGIPKSARAEMTSCDDAADMIAHLQGHRDATDVRELLGCPSSSSSCQVKNTRLFQLMVETT